MAELIPIPLPVLLKRAFLEYRREAKLFDLPAARIFRGIEGIDFAVESNGHRAATPLGPAAGPHTQLAQNIALSWLAGARIIELKTVQVLDELKISRPCIDVTGVGYNVEWSQELRLEQSAREYATAAMLIAILQHSGLLGAPLPEPAIFDMSVGYNLEGLRSPRVRQWIAAMKDASAIVDELRGGLGGEFRRFRDLPFPARLSDTVTLSTFHGCPAGEIEGIVTYLLEEMGLHVCVKMNPTLLGQAEVEHLLHDVLGYREIQLSPPAFANDLQFDEALHLIPLLDRKARACGRQLSVKFSNTLVVRNHRSFFSDELMYMSGAPLHVLTLNLLGKFRARLGHPVPVSFSAGLDANNVASVAAMNLVPVTTCTDLLRPGGYARLPRYLERLAGRMRDLGLARIPDYVLRAKGNAGAAIEQVFAGLGEPVPASLREWAAQPPQPLDRVCAALPVPGLEQKLVDAAGLLNTPLVVAEATANPRYTYERNQAVPRKIGSKLWLYDCIACDKCVPVCPNDANFVYETTQAGDVAYDNVELTPAGAGRIPGGVIPARKAHQFANYADACNECGHCDNFCPEDGGPYLEKPRFFGSLESWRRDARGNGFYMEFEGGRRTIRGAFGGGSYVLTLDGGRARFSDGAVEVEIETATGAVLDWTPREAARTVDLRPYVELKLLLEAAGGAGRVHYANVTGFEEATVDG